MKSVLKEILIFENQLNVDIERVCGVHSDYILSYLYIFHNKGTANPHYHIILKCRADTSNDFIANWFEVPKTCLCTVRTNLSRYMSYLLYSYKHNYKITDLKTNLCIGEI